MLIPKESLEKIKKIIERRHNSLLLSLVGPEVLSEEDLLELKEAGFNVEESPSLLEMVYYNNVLNELRSANSPKNISEMRKQQKSIPEDLMHTSAVEHINENFSHSLENLKADVKSRVEGLIRDANMEFRAKALQDSAREGAVDSLIRESSVGKIKQSLRDYTGDASRNWERVAVTETSNALGLGSADRIIKMNEGKDLKSVFVFRIPVRDAALCKHCRRFYLDSDETPALYRMSTLLGNGTNYGKKAQQWNPVIGATHPNDRESGAIELRPGWKVLQDGKLEYIGLEKWDEYISKKLRS
jgi:hypothetical protein